MSARSEALRELRGVRRYHLERKGSASPLVQLWVDRAREAGATWAEVAAELGCSRQWAIKRYGTRRNPR